MNKKDLTNRIKKDVDTCNRTDLYYLYSKVVGRGNDSINVYKWASYYINSKRDRILFDIVVLPFKKEYYVKPNVLERRMQACKAIRSEIVNGFNSYSKIPYTDGNTLMMCSPYYGYRDYNRYKVCDVEGNEMFCKKMVEISVKIQKKLLYGKNK